MRGHLAEFGFIACKGPGHVEALIAQAGDPASDLPAEARPTLAVLVEALTALQARVAELDREIAARAKADATARRLMTVPGIGPVATTALVALAPAAHTFRRGRDFAAWLGLTPLQHSSGGKERLGRTSKRGERSLRRLLILGASAAARIAALDGARATPWLAGMLARKSRQWALSPTPPRLSLTTQEPVKPLPASPDRRSCPARNFNHQLSVSSA